LSSGENNGGKSGIGFTGLLTILFIALKLTGVIQWKWVWVLSPLWISTLFAILIVIIVAIVTVVINK